MTRSTRPGAVVVTSLTRWPFTKFFAQLVAGAVDAVGEWWNKGKCQCVFRVESQAVGKLEGLHYVCTRFSPAFSWVLLDPKVQRGWFDQEFFFTVSRSWRFKHLLAVSFDKSCFEMDEFQD